MPDSPQPAATPAPVAASNVEGVAAADHRTPADRYHELFVAVQMQRVFDDGKTFVDAAPRREPRAIVRDYRAAHRAPGFDLRAFVAANFDLRRACASPYTSDPEQNIVAHIDGLWDVLRREPAGHPPLSSLLPLPHPYVVPGGRFDEIYYWDSYFTMLGLLASGRTELVRGMVDNFAYLIDTYGHVPNGNRSYYLSRSHPPLFAGMVGLIERAERGGGARYLPALRQEHAFWCGGDEHLAPGRAHRHVVRLADGTLLNRYWDARAEPREESYREDVLTAQQSARPAETVYRDLRAAAASGWDFSTRWFGDEGDLASTRTTSIVPVDLNCFLHQLEATIAALEAEAGDEAAASAFRERAAARAGAIRTHLWDQAQRSFVDYDWERDAPRRALNAAAVTPLFVGIATPLQAAAQAATLRERLLLPGGLAPTERESDQQWDRPNGWAPLQWLAIEGLRGYGETALADDIARRFLTTVARVYRRRRKLVEKYRIDERGLALAEHGEHAGGEYELQDGFGWTNGVTRALLLQYPEFAVSARRQS